MNEKERKRQEREAQGCLGFFAGGLLGFLSGLLGATSIAQPLLWGAIGGLVLGAVGFIWGERGLNWIMRFFSGGP